MTSQSRLKVSPINLRALIIQKQLIDRAAALLHKSRSDFMLEAACKEAQNVLLDQRLFFVDEQKHQDFIKQLEAPLSKKLEFKALLKSRSPWDE